MAASKRGEPCSHPSADLCLPGVESRQQGSARPREVDTASVWGCQSHCQAEEALASKTGAPRTAFCPQAPLSCLKCAESEQEGGKAGPWPWGARGGGLSAPGFTLFPGKRPGGSPKALSGLASERRGPGHSGRPQPGGRGLCVSSTSRVWPPGPGLEQRQGEQACTGRGGPGPLLPRLQIGRAHV